VAPSAIRGLSTKKPTSAKAESRKSKTEGKPKAESRKSRARERDPGGSDFGRWFNGF
jgi:hypothetical protein